MEDEAMKLMNKTKKKLFYLVIKKPDLGRGSSGRVSA
jgi:hypothetical protein